MRGGREEEERRGRDSCWPEEEVSLRQTQFTTHTVNMATQPTHTQTGGRSPDRERPRSWDSTRTLWVIARRCVRVGGGEEWEMREAAPISMLLRLPPVKEINR